MNIKSLILCACLAIVPAMAGKIVTYTATSKVSQEEANNAAIAGVAKQVKSQVSATQTQTKYEDITNGKSVLGETYRAKNNVGVMEMIRGNELNALDNFQEAMDKGKQPEAYANMAIMALQHGGLDTAEEYLSNATGAAGMNRVLGTLNIAKGNYSLAQQNLTGESSNMAALAQILNKDYSTATQTLARIKDGDALTDYLNALLLARTGQNDKASEFLRKAAFADPSLASFADRDIEMQNVKK